MNNLQSKLVFNLALNEFDHFKSNLNDIKNIDFKDSNGKTLLHYAVEQNKLKFVDYLLDKGSKVDTLDSKKETSLFRAVSDYNQKDLEKIKIIEQLLLAGANPNYKKTKKAYSILHMSFMCKNIALIKLLLKHKANPNEAENRMQWTPLFFAFSQESLNLLLTKKVDVDVLDKIGDTATIQIILLSNEDEALLMISNICKVSEEIEKNTYNYILHAFENGKMKIVQYLIDRYHNSIHFNLNNSILKATKNEDYSLVEKLMSYANNPEQIIEIKTGRSPVHYAILNNDIKLVKMFLEAGCKLPEDIDIKKVKDLQLKKLLEKKKS